MNSIARHGDLRHVKRLRVDRAVNGKRVQLAEVRGVHVAGSESGFDDVLPGTGVVVVIRGDNRQSCGSQGFGSRTLRTWRGVSRQEIVARLGSTRGTSGLPQLHNQQHHHDAGAHG